MSKLPAELRTRLFTVVAQQEERRHRCRDKPSTLTHSGIYHTRFGRLSLKTATRSNSRSGPAVAPLPQPG